MSLPAWMPFTVAALLSVVASSTSCRQAKEDALAMERAETAQGEVAIAAHFIPEKLPPKTKDGRVIPRKFGAQWRNAAAKLIDAGEVILRDCSADAFLKIGGLIAGYSKNSRACHLRLTEMAEKGRADATTINRVQLALIENGFGKRYSRITQRDRTLPGQSRPGKSAKTTVRVIVAIPPQILARLTYDEILSLIANGHPGEVGARRSPDAPAAETPAAQSVPQDRGTPPAAPSAGPTPPIFAAFADIFGREWRKLYGSSGAGMGAPPTSDGIARTVAVLEETFAAARAYSAQHGLGIPAEVIEKSLSKRIARKWLANPGSDGERLRVARHPFAWLCGYAAAKNPGDIGTTADLALADWRERNPPPPPPASSPEPEPEQLLEDEPTSEKLDVIEGDLARLAATRPPSPAWPKAPKPEAFPPASFPRRPGTRPRGPP